jgi:hypothetical protein
LPKSPSEVGEDMGSTLVFRPHAIIATDRFVPSPIFVAALIGVEKILRIDFDTSHPEASITTKMTELFLRSVWRMPRISLRRPNSISTS